MHLHLLSHRFFPKFSLTLLLAAAAIAPAHSVAPHPQLASPQTKPQRSPAPSALPGLPASERPSPQTGKTEQYTLSNERYEKAVSYSRASYTLYFLSYFLGFLVLFLILRLGLAAKFRDLAEDVTGNKWLQALVFVPLLVLTVDLFDLPLSIYWHSLSLHYQQSVQRWGSWFLDWGKEELLGAGYTLLLALILFAVMRRSPRRWWIYFWFAALPILLGFVFLGPLVIDPLFNKFEPLADQHPQLVASIETLTRHAGVPIPADRMFLMKASEKTNSINAYVTGLGASKRVVIWDTTLQKTTNDEALFIVGHELGHYVLGHVWKAFVGVAIGLFFALYLMFRALHWSLDRWGKDWRLYGPEDWASLAVLLLLLQILTFLSSPVVNGISRIQEHAADVYGLEVTHGIIPNPEEVAAHSFQVIGENDLADPNPGPFITFWLYSHPPLADRLIFAHTYDPWSQNQPPKYVK